MSSNNKKLWHIAGPGRPPAFNGPEDMWAKAVEYFEWCDANSLPEVKLFAFQGTISADEVYHMRAMTQEGLCIFLNIGVSTWHDYKKKPEFSEVIQQIEKIIYEQKFTGAAAGRLNANIIARDLGLKDESKVDHSSKDGSMSPAGNTFDVSMYEAAQAKLKGKMK